MGEQIGDHYPESIPIAYEKTEAIFAKGSEIDIEDYREVCRLADEIFVDSEFNRQIITQPFGGRTLWLKRLVKHDPAGNEGWGSDFYPHMYLEENLRTRQTWSYVPFPRLQEGEWSHWFVLTYFKNDAVENSDLKHKRQLRFSFDANNGNLLVKGDHYLYEELGFPHRAPEIVLTNLLSQLKELTSDTDD